MTLTIGDKAPSFKLPSTDRKDISLKEFENKKHVLLVFYPLAFTPG